MTAPTKITQVLPLKISEVHARRDELQFNVIDVSKSPYLSQLWDIIIPDLSTAKKELKKVLFIPPPTMVRKYELTLEAIEKKNDQYVEKPGGFGGKLHIKTACGSTPEVLEADPTIETRQQQTLDQMIDIKDAVLKLAIAHPNSTVLRTRNLYPTDVKDLKFPIEISEIMVQNCLSWYYPPGRGDDKYPGDQPPYSLLRFYSNAYIKPKVQFVKRQKLNSGAKNYKSAEDEDVPIEQCNSSKEYAAYAKANGASVRKPVFIGNDKLAYKGKCNDDITDYDSNNYDHCPIGYGDIVGLTFTMACEITKKSPQECLIKLELNINPIKIISSGNHQSIMPDYTEGIEMLEKKPEGFHLSDDDM